MNTEEMIQGLARKGHAVDRPARPDVLFLVWAAVTMLYLAYGIMLIGARDDLAQVWHRSAFLIHTFVVACLAVLAAKSAFVLSIPDRNHRWAVRMPVTALAAWLAWIVGALVGVDEPQAGGGRGCVQNILALGVPIGMLMYYMLSKAAPLRTSTTGWLAALSAAAAGDLATRLICRNDHALHALVWHFIPVLVIGCTGILLGRILLKWESANLR